MKMALQEHEREANIGSTDFSLNAHYVPHLPSWKKLHSSSFHSSPQQTPRRHLPSLLLQRLSSAPKRSHRLHSWWGLERKRQSRFCFLSSSLPHPSRFRSRHPQLHIECSEKRRRTEDPTSLPCSGREGGGGMVGERWSEWIGGGDERKRLVNWAFGWSSE